MIMPICYKLNQPLTVVQELAECERLGTSRIGIDVLYWGSSYEKVNKEERTALRANHGFEHWYARDLPDIMKSMFTSAAGDLRNIIALLLFMNRTQDIRIDDQLPPHRGWVGPRPALLLKHSVIRLKLDPKPMFRKLYGRGGSWRRRHDVKGHFCHDKKAHAHRHDHDWTETHVNQWRCLLCGGKKWWKKHHQRGHMEKGYVATSYEVTK